MEIVDYNGYPHYWNTDYMDDYKDDENCQKSELPDSLHHTKPELELSETVNSFMVELIMQKIRRY